MNREILQRISYNAKYRIGSTDKLRSGFSGIESGPCCKKCLLKPKDARTPINAIAACRNPFQLADVCECHLPYRKVAVESEQALLEALASAIRTLSQQEDGK